MLKTIGHELSALGWTVRTLLLAAVAAAVYKELQLPPEQRTWHGRLMGVVPYDFRLPSPRRMIDAWWNPGSKKLIHDQPFGVGWTVNIPAAMGLLSRLTSGGRGRAHRRTRARTTGGTTTKAAAKTSA